jgi:cellulose biosynthesis protein BcsQ/energy-coupling factor transporter ATP-binding protein EcfA2
MGEIITFYSYKGGVGRTMALANIAILLSQWGYKVLMVDWDLEAPGLEFFFEKFPTSKDIFQAEGVIELLHEMRNSQSSSKWQDFCVEIQLPNHSTPLHFLSAGNTYDKNYFYFSKVKDLDVDDFYDNNDGGNLIENLRNEWKQEYDFVLIDSRTGVTDLGGICTIQLPDILALFFSATKQGLKGILNVANNVTLAQQDLPLDRYTLVSVPIPSRIDVSKEFESSQTWLNTFEETLSELYDNWLPRNVSKRDFIEITKIPYIPYFSFGERLAVREHNTIDPQGLGYTYATLSALLAHKLESIEQLMENRSEFVKSVIKTPHYKNKPKTFANAHDSFIKAYNNFDAQALRGEKLNKFYIDDFIKDSVKEMVTTIRMTERFQKMLVIGHRGCGKSTILNKVAEELQNDYHVVAFSIADFVNMMDVEAVDILLETYLQVLQSVEKLGEFDNLRQSFRHFFKLFSKNDFKLEKVSLLYIAFKFKVEPDFRATIREGLRNQIDALQQNISEACHHIHQRKGKDVLIIIDDLDKLETQFAERVFYANSDLLLLPDAKIVYTFPLDTYYHIDFRRIRDRYQNQFISVHDFPPF